MESIKTKPPRCYLGINGNNLHPASAMKWAWDLNTLSLGGDDFAISTGVDPISTRRNILVLSTLMTSM